MRGGRRAIARDDQPAAELDPGSRKACHRAALARTRWLGRSRLALYKRLLDDEMAGHVARAFDKAISLKHLLQLSQHRRTAAHHDAVGCDVERRLSDIVEELFGRNQIGDAAAVPKRLARDGRIVDQLVAEQRPEQ